EGRALAHGQLRMGFRQEGRHLHRVQSGRVALEISEREVADSRRERLLEQHRLESGAPGVHALHARLALRSGELARARQGQSPASRQLLREQGPEDMDRTAANSYARRTRHERLLWPSGVSLRRLLA